MEGTGEEVNGTHPASNGPNMVPEEEGNEVVQPQQQEFAANPSERLIDEASLEDRVPMSDEMLEEPKEFDDILSKIRRLNEKTEYLHADEQLLKEELKVREKETLATFAVLMEKKKELVKLIEGAFNKSEAGLDIGLTEEFQQLGKIIRGQEKKIEDLRADISRQGIAGVLADDNEFKMKAKIEEMHKEIKVGRKFSSTQYVRDYLERPQAYKVSYEESKYEYELKVRIKECLQLEKKVYEKKKEEINQLKRKEREKEQELLKEKDYWSR